MSLGSLQHSRNPLSNYQSIFLRNKAHKDIEKLKKIKTIILLEKYKINRLLPRNFIEANLFQKRKKKEQEPQLIKSHKVNTALTL